MAPGEPAEPGSKAELDGIVKASDRAVIFFWAKWAEETCKDMGELLKELAAEHLSITFASVNVDALPEAVTAYGVSAVPAFALFRAGDSFATVEGADAPTISAKVDQLAAEAVTKGGDASGKVVNSLDDRLKALTNCSDVVLFMKGTPSEPRCGFSKRVVQALEQEGITDYASFDILKDNEVREGLKRYSDWPTYPQLYFKGSLVGGCDIVEELRDSEQLRQELVASHSDKDQHDDSPRGKIERLLDSAEAVLFMKGSPEQPRCGFSKRVVNCLRDIGAEFRHFDVLEDEGVREELKRYSDWPTYPQLYVNKELIGGCDIVEELHGSGQLASNLRKVAH